MHTLRICTQCREPLPTDASGRLCSRCESDPGRTTTSTPGSPRKPAPAPAEIAQSFPQLEILELLGHGGMGMVYKARQPQLNRLVALKILAPELSGDPAFAERFMREAQSMASLHHSNIVSIHDFGRTPDGLYYFLMEYVEGTSLYSLIQAKQLQPDDARRIVTEICHGLHYAHEEGFVHRDIKPSNILIDKKGRAKIADFGLVKLAAKNEDPRTRNPLTTLVMGTPHYMAPEQIETPAVVDHRADLYSLGVVFYEMLTGELPIGRFLLPSQKVPGLDVRMDETILRALENDRTRRFQQAVEFRAALETPAPPAAPVPAKPASSHGLVRQFLLMLSAALLAVLIYVMVRDHNAPHRNRPNQPPVQVDYGVMQEGPLTERKIILALQLTKPQMMDVNRILHRYQREFAGLERSHTSSTEDKQHHIHLVTKPFPEAMQQMLDRMQKELAGALTDNQMGIAHTLEFDKFFPHTGQETIRAEIWRGANGGEHYVESEDPGVNAETTPAPLNQLPRPMPPRYRYYLPNNP